MHRNHFIIVHDSTNIIHLRYVEYDLEKDLKYTTKELKELGLPIVRFALWGVVFGLDFSPFFFLLLFPCHVLFIYLLFN